MANFEKMIAKLNGIGQRKQEEAENEHFKRAQTIVEYENKVIALAPRIKKLMEIAKAMLASDVPFGKRTKDMIGYDEEFITDGIKHHLGFYFEFAKDNSPLIGIGIKGGGCCGRNLAVDVNGNMVVKIDPYYHSYQYDGYWDYCHKCKELLNNFDGFERRVYEYVESL